MSEDVLNKEYGAPVDRLLTYGEAEDVQSQREWPDYLALGFTQGDIPELVRMACDRQLHQLEEDSLAVWAPVHAWRALGQLKAAAAVDSLLGLFRLIDEADDDWVNEELPQVMSMIGLEAVASLEAFLGNAGNSLFARVAAIQSLTLIGRENGIARERCVGVFVKMLRLFPVNEPEINAFLIDGLAELKAVETIDLIRAAFRHGQVDCFVRGDIEDVEMDLGLRTARTAPRRPNRLKVLQDETSNDKKIGRNDPCHCGSGKKYKKCCLAKDEEKRHPVPLDLTDEETEEVVRNSRKYPLRYVLINEGWKDQGIATVMLMRAMDESHYILGVYLIDTQCLGVKNASYGAGLTKKQIDEMVSHYPGDMNDFCLGCAQQLIAQAEEYARNLGFEPHSDFGLAQYVLGDKEDCKEVKFTFGGPDGRPWYVAGPEDDRQAIYEKLTARLGKDGFAFIVPEDNNGWK